MKKLFGTDGVRGVANEELTPEMAFSLGRVGGHVLTAGNNSKNNFIIIGKDTRQSGDMLEAALSAGICSIGVDVWQIGVAPTPVVAWLVRKYQALSGIVISASHNPAKDNGIKFFNNQGQKLADEIELEIERVIESEAEQLPRPIAGKVGRIFSRPEIVADYAEYLTNLCSFPINRLKVAIDAGNGANYLLAEKVFQNLGISVKVINKNPDGENINHNCGSTHLDSLKRMVKEEEFDLGIAYDGDADRCLAIDENGEEIDGDQIMYICCKYLPELTESKVLVSTLMSNFGFEVAIKEMGKAFIRANVGDRYVLEEINKTGAKIGGEQSGHLIFPEYNSTGDGLLSSLKLLEAVHRSGESLGTLKKDLKLFPQILINVPVQDKSGYSGNEKISLVVKEAEETLGNKGRILVRPSGTEPKIRVMVEGIDEELIGRLAEKVSGVIKSEL